MPEVRIVHHEFPIVTKEVPTFYFIGVTTGKSSIMKVFPLWAAELGRPEVVLEGVDLKLHDRPRPIARPWRRSSTTRCRWAPW